MVQELRRKMSFSSLFRCYLTFLEAVHEVENKPFIVPASLNVPEDMEVVSFRLLQ